MRTRKQNYQVIVGNVGMVYDGPSAEEARSKFDVYVELSKSHVGRAGGEDVTIFLNDEIVREFAGSYGLAHNGESIL